MSDEGSCEGERPDDMQHTASHNSAQNPDPAVPPAPTSHMCVKHALEVIQTLDEFMRFLVTSFDGMLQLQMLQKLNLKFSAWTMSKVSITRRAIVLAEKRYLNFGLRDVHKVFGIPCGHRNIKGRHGHIKPEAIRFIKSTLGMDKKGVHSLHAAEDFLMRDISESSSKLEKDCFQIAFVIFVMSNVLAPTTKQDYTTIDFWVPLANTETIDKFNWCEYVLEYLLASVRRLKNDILSNNPATNLVGCHLFLQVVICPVVKVHHHITFIFVSNDLSPSQILLLDNLDLGMFNKPHTVLPRVNVLDQDSIRRMTDMATDVGKPTTSYASDRYVPLSDPDPCRWCPSVSTLALMVVLTSCSCATHPLFATPGSSTPQTNRLSQGTLQNHRYSKHHLAVLAQPKL